MSMWSCDGHVRSCDGHVRSCDGHVGSCDWIYKMPVHVAGLFQPPSQTLAATSLHACVSTAGEGLGDVCMVISGR